MYTLNNPIKYIDPDGMQVWPPEGGTNGQTWSDSDGDFVNRNGIWYKDYGAFMEFMSGSRYESVNTVNTSGTPGYDGKTMLPSSSYDYTYDLMPGKQADDLNYWKNGERGVMASRVLETTARDAVDKNNVSTTLNVAAVFLTPVRGKGVVRSKTGKFTEPTLPEKIIVNERGVKVEHYYKSGDHAPAHFHVKGGGSSTKIGANGKPIKGSSELSKTQESVIGNNKSIIRGAGKKINNYQKYHLYRKNK